MPESPIQSTEFSAPYVRVRGRISRKGEVRLDYCLRTIRPPNIKSFSQKGGHGTVVQQTEQYIAGLSAQQAETLVVLQLLDERDAILETGYAFLDFAFKEAYWGAFVQRLNFKKNAVAVRVSLGKRYLGHFPLVNHPPQFTLTFSPRMDGVCTLSWASTDTPVRPYKYYVRYTGDGSQWYRPAVNLHDRGFELDLSDMPGGDKCVISVIASNGYNAAVASTMPFSLPPRPTKALLSGMDGPILFAQGFSLELGPISPGLVRWMMDGTHVIGAGGAIDVRKFGPGIHEIGALIRKPDKTWTRHSFGSFDCATGAKIPAVV